MNKRSGLLCAVAVSMFLMASFASLASYTSDGAPDAGWKILGAEIDFEAEGYIPVSSAGDLAKVGKGIASPSDHDGNTYDWRLGDSYYLTKDITLGGTKNNHTPIGTASAPFTGKFNGNGFAIAGIDVDITVMFESNPAAGLFGYVSGNAEISGLSADGNVKLTESAPLSSVNAGGIIGMIASGSQVTISGCNFSGSVTANGVNSYAGGILGISLGTVNISDCHNTAAVSAASDWDAAIVGGMAGKITFAMSDSLVNCRNDGKLTGNIVGGMIGYTSTQSVTLISCHNTGAIEGTSEVDRLYLGGMIGQMEKTVNLTDCHNTGAISGTMTYSGLAGAGGLVGWKTSGTLTAVGCYNTAAITLSIGGGSTSYSIAGGLLGYGQASFTNCYNTGDVSASSTESSSNAYAGGIASYGASTLTNCFNTGNVSASTAASSSSAYAGGLASYGGASVTNCYNTGDVTAIASIASAYAGGVAANNSGTIAKCYNTGNVTAWTTGASSISYAGGLTAYGSAAMTDCYNIGAVGSEGTGASAYAYAGGLLGYGQTAKMTDCYTAGTIAAAAVNAYAGGAAAYTEGFVTNCYYLGGKVSKNGVPADILIASTKTGQATVDGNADGTPREGIQGSGAKTSKELAADIRDMLGGDSIYFTDDTDISGSTYKGWDFRNTWTVVSGVNNGYPVFGMTPCICEMCDVCGGCLEEECCGLPGCEHTVCVCGDGTDVCTCEQFCDVCGGCLEEICCGIEGSGCHPCTCGSGTECCTCELFCDVCGGCLEEECCGIEGCGCHPCTCGTGGPGGDGEHVCPNDPDHVCPPGDHVCPPAPDHACPPVYGAAGKGHSDLWPFALAALTLLALTAVALAYMRRDEVEIEDIAPMALTGSRIAPEPAVRRNGAALKAGEDFEYSYGENSDAGTGTVTITFGNGRKIVLKFAITGKP